MTSRWTAAFRSAPVSPHEPMTLIHPPRGFHDQTLRQVVRLGGAGTRLRVRLGNLYGKDPLTIARIRVAAHRTAAAIVPGTDTAVTFGGAHRVTIPPGREAISDPVDLATTPGTDLVLSSHHAAPTGPADYHPFALQAGYLGPGDAVSRPDLPEAEPVESRFFLSGLDVLGPPDRPVVAAFGDSLTDGVGTTPGTHRRYPDLLARRLRPTGAAVLNLGIAGNRLLGDVFGERGTARFDRDVLTVPGVTHVVVQLGLNDIGLPGMLDQPPVPAADIIAGLAALAARARRHGIRPVIATVTPFAGAAAAGPGFDTPEARSTRRRLNDWIRTGDAYDAVADLDGTLRDPTAPAALHPDYDSGDHIHPNDAGAQAVADTVADALPA
ncbi:GDSL-type esterase/lipase family protein [Actinomadura algeriensis]|uniref:Lysophospholipase L1-like esterase n=1 Tax=Actinomadura algeriensis TaxID=1679523 RepID=A0ABR9JLL7_9ACTN|nr:GDSL-type esterase/lipase family protein [Actinomadura algeriensis]MBE1531318.1 lysophospholipase L1-like esterase [Actinomadura algeriensis]